MTTPNIAYREFLNRTEDHDKQMEEVSARITMKTLADAMNATPLDAQCEKILHDNLSNLYDDSP